MADLLRLVLTNFWPFVAACFLICVLGNAVAAIIYAMRGKDNS